MVEASFSSCPAGGRAWGPGADGHAWAATSCSIAPQDSKGRRQAPVKALMAKSATAAAAVVA